MKKLWAALCLLGAAYFLLPLLGGILHIGMLWPAAVLVLAALWLLRGRCWPRWLRRTLTACYALGLTLTAVLAAFMLRWGWGNPPPAETPCTLIVLGCQVRGDQPSLMLYNRIRAGFDYLTAHPDAPCVATGGTGDAAVLTEAQCIADTLSGMGIGPGRIYLEDASRSTAQNLAYAARIIREKGLSTNVAIASDGFHQLRAAAFARENGLTPYAVSCRSPWYLAGGYWCREMAGIAAMWFRGY